MLALTRKPELQALAAFLAVVGAMQLCEAMLWRHPECSETHGQISSIGAVVNHLEPFVLWCASVWLLKPKSAAWERAAALVVLAYCLLFSGITAEFLTRPLERRCARVTPNGLVWQWNDTSATYMAFLATLLITTYAYMPAGLDVAMCGAIGGTFAVSYGMYRSKAMVGSMWCFFAAFLPWLVYIFY